MGSAAVLGAAGLALEVVAAASAMRRRIAQLEAPPKELAKRQWARYAATARAAGEAWRSDAAARMVTAPTGQPGTTRRPNAVHEQVGM
jgi:hypothetical protein